MCRMAGWESSSASGVVDCWIKCVISQREWGRYAVPHDQVRPAVWSANRRPIHGAFGDDSAKPKGSQWYVVSICCCPTTMNGRDLLRDQTQRRLGELCHLRVGFTTGRSPGRVGNPIATVIPVFWAPWWCHRSRKASRMPPATKPTVLL